jgi:hypothetical protein
VEPGTNECGIRGHWYAYNDYPDCMIVRLSDCIDNQLPEEGRFPNEGGRMCTSGDTSVPATEGERTNKWGAGIGLKLNIDGGEKPISELPRTIVGFTFTVSPSNPSSPQDVPEGLLVNFPTLQTVRSEHFVDLVDPVVGSHEVYIADAKAPDWGDPASFDKSQVTAIQFYVPTITGESVHFDFCIENLTAVYGETLTY